jgi:transposase InsO family protein
MGGINMLSTQEFDNWCHRLNLSEVTRKVIEQIRSTEPVRQVQGGGGNVTGNYCSKKMGKTLKFESHKVELPGIEEYESSEDVLEFYDQPYQLTLKFQTKKGRVVTVTHIPDFIDWIKYRNRQFLKSYTEQKYQIKSSVATFIKSLVTSQPGITYFNLLQYQTVNPDDLNALIATEELYIDLSAAPLAEPEKVHIFRNRETAQAYTVGEVPQISTVANCLQIIDVAVGTSFCWDGQPLTVLHHGDSKNVLRSSNSLIHLTHSEFDLLVQRGEIVGLKVPEQRGIHPEAIECFLKASPESLAEANHRYQVIEPYLNGGKREFETVSERTIRNWKSKFRAAEQKYHWGYIGLFDNHAAKGNRTKRISQEAWEFIDKVIEEHYETLKQRGKMAVYGVLSQEWEKAGRSEHLPSYVTFSDRIKQRSGYLQTKKRLGSRAAYQKSNFYWELEFTTPRHGDRPFEICHIDHTQLDIELVCSRTGRPLGRPWATLLIDAMSRRILAVYLTFDEPSYRSCMMVLRICVQRFSRFPETIVVDGGAEFGSTYFETLLAAFECTKKQRPIAKARFGSVIERIFGTTETLLLNVLEPADTLVFLVFGVTGVGKTTLRLRLEKLLLEEWIADLQNNPGQIVVAGLEAVPAEKGNFSYKDYYTRALEAIKEVLIEYKVNYGLTESDFQGWKPDYHLNGKDSPALRRAMEKVFRYRQLKAFTVDEAQHLLMIAGGHQMLQQMNWIKSIANVTGTVHILFGTYELLNCATLNGQMGRRSEDIHLSPYQTDDPSDVAEFIRVISTFQRHLPLPKEPDFEKHYEYLLEGSVGCVGILKNWLTRSLRLALAESAPTLTTSHLKQGAFSASRINKIRAEAQQGERRFIEENSLSFQLESSKGSNHHSVNKSSSKRVRVGQRSPKRDTVGIEQYDN